MSVKESQRISKTIASSVTASIKVQRSEFIACLQPVSNVNKVRELISAHNEQYKDATHNCYAYVIGKNREVQYYADQGEPSGTAGKPILNVLLKHDLTNILAIVTRYFGGIKLGVRGLIEAYSEATEKALSLANLVDNIVLLKVKIECNYQKLDYLKKALKPYHAELANVNFSEVVEADILYPDDESREINKLLDELSQSGQIIITNPE